MERVGEIIKEMMISGKYPRLKQAKQDILAQEKQEIIPYMNNESTI